MILTPEYLAENKDCVYRNYKQIGGDRKSIRVQHRIKNLKDFCQNAKTILSVGCGAYEPIDLNATHACDIVIDSKNYLRQLGWKGYFLIASCDELPYPDKSTDVAVCSEVIEHLPNLEIVKKAFQEINRVAKRWIVTCPDVLGTEPTHKRVFDEKMLRDATDGLKVEIKHDAGYWYVIHDSS